jgi:predicted Zn finger-like uncharacterized protein
MRIRCPSCSATYEVADALLDPPRTVRCARCSEEWMAAPMAETPPPLEVLQADPEQPETAVMIQARAEPIAAALPDPPPRLEPIDPDLVLGDTPLSAIQRLAAPTDFHQSGRRRDRVLTAAWALSFAALAALGVAGYTERDLLMKQWPASKRVYATLGLVPSDLNPGTIKSTTDKATGEAPSR